MSAGVCDVCGGPAHSDICMGEPVEVSGGTKFHETGPHGVYRVGAIDAKPTGAGMVFGLRGCWCEWSIDAPDRLPSGSHRASSQADGWLMAFSGVNR